MAKGMTALFPIHENDSAMDSLLHVQYGQVNSEEGCRSHHFDHVVGVLAPLLASSLDYQISLDQGLQLLASLVNCWMTGDDGRHGSFHGSEHHFLDDEEKLRRQMSYQL